MLIEYCLIDSNIWYYSYILPERPDFMEVHEMASIFLSKKLQEKSTIIAISLYQIAEIMDLLRKGNLQENIRQDIFESFKTDKFLIRKIDLAIIQLSFQKSLKSGIHIYDYLVALPLKGVVTEIFSADDHFQHQDFKEIATVTNPLSPWILREGRLPIKSA